MVRRKDMEQLRALNQELVTLNEKYRNMPRSEEAADTYGDYRTGYKKIKVMRGYSTKKSDRLMKMINRKIEQIHRSLAEMEEWLDQVEDSEMRDILRLYYGDGLSLEEIGRRKGYDRSTIGKKLSKFWGEE